MRFADAGTVCDGGVGLKATLDLVGRDAIAEAIDHVVLATEKPDIAIRVAASEIAGQRTILSQPRTVSSGE